MSKERLYYAENASGRIYLSSPSSDLQPGYILRSTTKTKDMDLIFNRIHEQEREQNQAVIENIYKRGKENFDRIRSELRRKIGLHDTSNAEKNIIRASLKLMDEKEAKMRENTVYGVSAMQESPAPLPPRNTRVM